MAAGAANRSAPFRSPRTIDFGSGHNPEALAAADFNGDGKLDLAVGSEGADDVTTTEAGRKPYRNLRLADLDGDGRCDIVAPNMVERGVTILFGDGRGGFRGAQQPPVPAGPSPFAVVVADVNRDGKPDLVVANYSGHIGDSSSDGLTFLLNDGHGRFRLGPRIPTGSASGDAGAGDVDGDGYTDAVTANAGSNDLTVAYGGPDGLSPSRTVTVGYGGRGAFRVILGDLDGDGRADAVTANSESHSVSVLLTR